MLISPLITRQRVHVWQNVLPAAYGHAAVPVLPEAEAGVRREGRRHQGRDRDRKARHCVEDEPRGEGEAADQSAPENGRRVASPPLMGASSTTYRSVCSCYCILLTRLCVSSRLRGMETLGCRWR